jgi:hypothetical protein
MATKLYLYDKTSEIDRKQADGRFDDSDDVMTIGVVSVKMLKIVFDQLVGNNQRFDRLLVQTHGSPGNVYFGGDPLNATVLGSTFLGMGYEAVFPNYTRIYFDGCNVAAGSAGTQFLTLVGQIFCRRAGGEVFGFNNIGRGFPGWVPFIGGHTLHLGGDLKKLYFDPGGILKPDKPFDWNKSGD